MASAWPPPRRRVLVGGLAAAVCCTSSALYLPGLAPREYEEGVPVELRVNKLTSSRTQLPYGYYTLPYCRPAVLQGTVENLGEILTGDQIENSPYQIKMLRNETCQELCRVKLTAESKDKFKSMIEDEYLVNWILDNLPAATRYRQANGQIVYVDGFPVGLLREGRYYVHNHVTIDVQYHSNPELYEGYRIVGFEVEPRSHDSHGDAAASCQAATFLEIDEADSILFTYDVRWYESPIRWASRWDAYLKMSTGVQIHWFAILNSLLILLFLSGMVAMILLRTLHRDIARYNEVPTSEEAQEETGWKLVHGDVFRKPAWSTLLSVFVGSGIQVLGMSAVTLVFALLGLLSPAHRGGLLQSMIVLFTFMGIPAGFVAARLCKVFDGDEGRWKRTTVLTAFLVPGFFFAVFFVLNLCIWGQRSSGAVPFVTLTAVLVLWFGVSVPLVFFGAYLGFRRPAIELPVRVNAIPRSIPEQPWVSKPFVIAVVGGILPFGAVFTELFFIMSSLWLHQFYYLFGFLSLVLVILLVTCGLVSIALTYFQLTSEDYRWWWTAFFSSGSSALYVFLYAILYFTTKLRIEKPVSVFLYFGYMSLISTMFLLLTGSIGLLVTFAFVRSIYGSIKID